MNKHEIEVKMNKNEKENDIEKEWTRTIESIRSVRSVGGFQNFAIQHASEISGFLREPDHVCCIDERIPHKGAISIAGSGILIKDNPEALRVFVESLKAKKIKKVFMHENCGAVGLYANSKGISLEDANREALEWAKKLTQLLGGDELQKVLPVDIGFHNAQCAYVMLEDVSGIGKSFPRGFEISSCVSFSDILEQVKVSIDIALGGHGFGALFTKENPFTVVVIDLATVKEHADLVQLVAQYNGRAVIDGFVVQGA